MGRIQSAFDRLSTREKALVSVMVGLFLLAGVALGYLWLGTAVSDMETRLTDDSETLREIYDQAGPYLEEMNRTESRQKAARKNLDLNLKLAVNDIAKSITFNARGRDGNIEGTKKLSDVMQFDQTQETFLSRKKKKGRARKDKKDADVGYYRRDQPVTLSDNVEFESIYKLLEKIEESRDLIYITDLELTRDFQNGRVARKNASFVVSTYYYKGKEE